MEDGRVRAPADVVAFTPSSIFQSSILAAKKTECRGLAPLARRHTLVSTEARHACPVDIPKGRGVAGCRSKVERCKLRSRARLACNLQLETCNSENWYRVKDLHLQPSRSERDASALG